MTGFQTNKRTNAPEAHKIFKEKNRGSACVLKRTKKPPSLLTYLCLYRLFVCLQWCQGVSAKRSPNETHGPFVETGLGSQGRYPPPRLVRPRDPPDALLLPSCPTLPSGPLMPS